MKCNKAAVAIIGAGTVARENQIPAFLNCADAEVVAVFDRHIERAEELAKQFAIPKVYSDYNELLADDQINSVSICTGNTSHEGLVISAADAGKNIICEKPMAINVAQARRMYDAVKRNDTVFMMGFVNRFRQESILISEFADCGRFGDIYHARCGWIRRRGTPQGWFTDSSKSGGGALIDIGVHVLDLTWYIMGRPKPIAVSGLTHCGIGDYQTKSVRGWTARGEKSVFDTEDCATALIRFENGASLSVDISWAINGKEEKMFSKIYGTKGGASLAPLELYSEENGYLTDVSPIIIPEKNWQGAFEREINHFSHCVITGETPIPSAYDGLTVQRMLNGIYESAELKKEIML